MIRQRRKTPIKELKDHRVRLFPEAQILTICASAYNAFFKNYGYVFICFDEDKRRVGLHPTKPSSKKAPYLYKIQNSLTRPRAIYILKGLMNTFNVSETPRSYLCTWLKREQSLVFYLDKPIDWQNSW